MAVPPKFSNQLNVSFTRLCRNSESLGDTFPAVGILNQSGGLATAFSFEPFSANNLIKGDRWHLTNDFTVYQGRHSITIGTSKQLFSFENNFAPLANPYFLRFAGHNEEGQPQFSFPLQGDAQPLQQSFQDDFSIFSRWRMQLCLRYSFK